MATKYRLNESGVDKARELIDAHQYVLESSWSDDAPSADDENADIDRHDWDQYGDWHLAIDTEAQQRPRTVSDSRSATSGVCTAAR